jgi:Na+/phosphate symporter
MNTRCGENLTEYFKVNKIVFEEIKTQLTDFCLAHLNNLQIEVIENCDEMAELTRRVESGLNENRRLEDERRKYRDEMIDERHKMIGDFLYKTMISQLLRSLLGDKSIERNELIFSALKMIEGVKPDINQRGPAR